MKQPIFSLKPKKHWWQKDKIILERAYSFTFEDCTITLKKGFDSDGASIPRLLWWISNPFDSQTIQASLCHDALYWARATKRVRADNVFLFLMGINEVPLFKRMAFYNAVRLFGWMFYYLSKKPSDKEIKKYLQIKKSML